MCSCTCLNDCITKATYAVNHQLNIVFESLIVNRIRHAISACGGFATADLRGTINAVLWRALRYGFCKNLSSVKQIMEVAGRRFFTAIQYPGHCINCILPDIKECSVHLRRKRHQYQLPQYEYDIHRK